MSKDAGGVLNSEMPEYRQQPFVSPIMIGRDLATQTLLQLYEQVRSGRGRIALINGEAGIGKSRLVREFTAQHLTARVLQGSCYELDQVQPYAPFIDMLRSMPPLTPTTTASPSTYLRELALLLPGLNTEDTESGEDEPDPRQIIQMLTEFFMHEARSHHLVLIVEDLHWCDDASLEYLAYLAQRLKDLPSLLILTWRSDGLSPALIRCIAAIERTRLATEIKLAPLSLTESEAMLTAIFEQKRLVRADILATLHTLTEGNPFFIEEILRSLTTYGDDAPVEIDWDSLSSAQLRMPRTVQASVQQRTNDLTSAARQVLTLATVIGRRFDFPLLKYLTRQDDAELLQCLRDLVLAQLVAEEAPDTFGFRHALTRQAIYTSLLARERRALHRDVALAIEEIYPDKRHDALLIDLAHHYYQGELWAKAMQFAMEAGQHARMLHSPIAALEHFTMALSSARHLNLDPSPGLLQARGKVYEMLGEFEAARGDFEQAIEVARKSLDVGAEAQGLLDLGFLWTARDYDTAGDYFGQAAALARNSNDSAMLANILNRIGLSLTHAERPFDGLLHHEEALAIYRQLEDAQGIGESLDLLGVTAFMAGDMAAGWRYFDEAIALCRMTDNRPRLAANLLTASIRGGAQLVDTLVWIPDAQHEGIKQCEEAIQIAGDIRLPATEAYARIMLAHILVWQGAWGRARSEAKAALAIAEDIDHRMWKINAQAVLGALHLEALDYTAALDYLEDALRNTEGMGSLYMLHLVFSLLSRIYIARNQLQQAGQVLERLITPTLPTETLAQRLIWTAQAELMLALQRPDVALDIVDRLIASARNATEATVIPKLWFLRGQTLVALHRNSEAEAVLQTGFDVALAWNNRSLAWKIGVDLGYLCLARGKRFDAQDTFVTCRSIIEEIASELPVGDLRDRFCEQAIGALPRSTLVSPRKAAQRAFDGLTRREREVAALVAQGLTNHAIADSLTLSERTIEKHIANIMGKLGFSARSQIAVWAVKKNLHD